MGNQADPESADTTIGEVESAVMFITDRETGRGEPLRGEDGAVQIVSPDSLDVAIASVDINALDSNLLQVGGQAQSAVDVAAQIDALADALNSVDADELVSRLTDSQGTQIDPDQSPDYPDDSQQQDLTTGDLTIGPVSVARSEAIIISANSTDGNTWSASVEWQDGAGNVLQTESAADIELSAVTEDWARLVRKAPQVAVTFTDESGAATNRTNAYVDVHR